MDNKLFVIVVFATAAAEDYSFAVYSPSYCVRENSGELDFAEQEFAVNVLLAGYKRTNNLLFIRFDRLMAECAFGTHNEQENAMRMNELYNETVTAIDVGVMSAAEAIRTVHPNFNTEAAVPKFREELRRLIDNIYKAVYYIYNQKDRHYAESEIRALEQQSILIANLQASSFVNAIIGDTTEYSLDTLTLIQCIGEQAIANCVGWVRVMFQAMRKMTKYLSRGTSTDYDDCMEAIEPMRKKGYEFLKAEVHIEATLLRYIYLFFYFRKHGIVIGLAQLQNSALSIVHSYDYPLVYEHYGKP